jgi:hypothetical protein
VASLIVLARSRHFYIEVGSPLEMDLPQTVTLAEEKSTGGNLTSRSDVPDGTKSASGSPQAQPPGR